MTAPLGGLIAGQRSAIEAQAEPHLLPPSHSIRRRGVHGAYVAVERHTELQWTWGSDN
jgi:hypothetical protein